MTCISLCKFDGISTYRIKVPHQASFFSVESGSGNKKINTMQKLN